MCLLVACIDTYSLYDLIPYLPKDFCVSIMWFIVQILEKVLGNDRPLGSGKSFFGCIYEPLREIFVKLVSPNIETSSSFYEGYLIG